MSALRGLIERRSRGDTLWLHALLVAACLATIALLAPRLAGYAPLLLAGGAALLVLPQRPHLLLPGLIAASLLVPFSIGTGTQTEVPVTLLLLAALLALWLAEMLARRRLALDPSPANLPWLALILVAGVATLVGNALWNPVVATKGNFAFVQLAQWAVFVFSAGAFWLAANLAGEPRRLRWMVGTFLGLGAVYVGAWLLPGGYALVTRLFARGSAGSVFWVWLVALAGGQVLFNRRLDGRLRVALALLVLVALNDAWFGGRTWVSGWSPPLVALLALLWLRSARWGAALTVGAAAALRLFYPFFYTNVVGPALETGSFLRLDAWRGIAELVGGRWPLGLGLAAYWHYWRDLLRTWAYSSTNVVYNPNVSSHNNYVDLYAQMGVVGLAVFAWLAVALWRQGWRMRTHVPEGFERGYVYGCLAGLAGTLWAGMLADWFFPFVYNVGLTGMRSSILAWLFLGGLAGLEGMVRRGSGQPA